MKLSTKTFLSYGTGNLGYATISQTVNNFIMFFGTSVLGVSGTLVGLAVALSTFWDGISDPVVGHISDNFHSKKYGKRTGFMIFGTIGMVIFNVLLWSVPLGLSEGAKFVWLLVCLLLLETCCTTFSTPYVALGIDIAPEYQQQSKLQGFKTIFFIFGMILPSVLMFVMMPSGSGQGQFLQSGYIGIAYVTSAICLLAGLISILGTKKFDREVYKSVPLKKKSTLKEFFQIFYTFFRTIKKPNFSPIIIGYSVALISTAFLSSVGLHLFTYAYHFTSMHIAMLMGSLFVSAILSQPVWVHLSNRLDKKPALQISLVVILAGIFLAVLSFLVRGSIPTNTLFYFVAIALLVCGFGTGALYSLPISMYADCITIEKGKTGQNNSGVYSGFMTLAYNISNCLALFVVGVLLDLIRFNPKEPVQALVVQNWLGVIVFAGCGLSILCALFIFSKYRLKRSAVLKSRLKQKRHTGV